MNDLAGKGIQVLHRNRGAAINPFTIDKLPVQLGVRSHIDRGFVLTMLLLGSEHGRHIGNTLPLEPGCTQRYLIRRNCAILTRK